MKNQTGMTWGNLSSHLSKLEEVEYVKVEKKFVQKKPHSMVKLTEKGKNAFEEYRKNLKQVLEGPSD